MLVRKPEYHQDLFLAALQSEVNELKSRQGDYAALMDVYRQLEMKFHDSMLDTQSMQVEHSGLIEKDRLEAETMVQELELVKAENATAEQDQLAILDSIAVVERDVYAACRELNDTRMQYTSADLQIMDVKKQIDCQEHLKCECQNVGLAQYEKIKELSDYHNTMSIDCVNAQKQIETLLLEAQMNEEKIRSASDLLHMTSERMNETSHKLMEVEKEIAYAKDQLMHLDEELNYMEQCNDRHK